MPAVPITDDLRDAFRVIAKISDPVVRHQTLENLLTALPVSRWPELLNAIEKMNANGEFEDELDSLEIGIGALEQLGRVKVK